MKNINRTDRRAPNTEELIQHEDDGQMTTTMTNLWHLNSGEPEEEHHQNRTAATPLVPPDQARPQDNTLLGKPATTATHDLQPPETRSRDVQPKRRHHLHLHKPVASSTHHRCR
jgi:hypothetical protein